MTILMERQSGIQQEPRRGVRHIREDAEVEVGSLSEDNSVVSFGGYMFKWDDVAEIRDFFGEYEEQFAQGSFKRTIAERGPGGTRAIKMLSRHDQRVAQCGKFVALYEDSEGLAFDAETLDTSTGRDLAVEIREGVMNTMSVGFDSIVEEYDKERNRFTVKEAKMYEGSPVLWPAYDSGTIDNFRASEIVPILERINTMMASGKEMPEEVRRQLEAIHARIGTIIANPPDGAVGTDEEATASDHAEDIGLARLRMAEMEARLN